MENYGKVHHPFTDVAIRHYVPAPSEDSNIWIDVPAGMLNRERGNKHLRIRVIDIVDECDFFVVNVNN